jgi:hypothetical protein
VPGLPCRGSGAGPSCSIVSDRVARIAAAGGAFALEDEVDPAKFARSIELISAPNRFLDEVARAGGGGLECEKMLGDA